MLKYPKTQRRVRASQFKRELAGQICLTPSQFIQPIFVVEGLKEKESIPGLTGVFRETTHSLLEQIEHDLSMGVSKFLLFPVSKQKASLSGNFNHRFAETVISEIKKNFGDQIFLAVDVCLCSSTHSGQCGILNAEGTHVLNSETVETLAVQAGIYAQAGADCVAPSDMMDGRIAAIRKVLDSQNNDDTLIMSYSAKFNSKFYGPFRLAADSAPKGNSSMLKDRSTYQIDPSHYNDALCSSWRDVEEGADILMVKPGMPYLDVLYRLSQTISKPWSVYQVSGEYAAIELLSQQNLMNGPLAHLEAWRAFLRAGAHTIISYGARNVQNYLKIELENL